MTNVRAPRSLCESSLPAAVDFVCQRDAKIAKLVRNHGMPTGKLIDNI